MLPGDDLRNHFPSKPSFSEIVAFTGAARDGNVAEISRLLGEYGAAIINERDNINARAITWAACNGHLEVVELLLDHGAAIDAKGTAGKAALSWAAEMSKPDIVSLLLDRGASVEDRDDAGSTALDYARQRSNNDITTMIEQHIEERKAAVQQKVHEKEEAEVRNLTMERLEKLKKSRPQNLKLPPAPAHPVLPQPGSQAPEKDKPASRKHPAPKHRGPGN